MDREVVHVVSSKHGGAHKARGYNRGKGPRRSNAFDVAPEGAEAAPKSFKGYTLGSYAPNNLAVNPPPLTSSPNNASRSRFRTLGSFSLFDEIELRAVASSEHQSSIPISINGLGGSTETAPVVDEEGSSLCGLSIIGPFSPFLGSLTLRHVGWSSVLLDSTLLLWRFILCVLALATAITTTVIGIRQSSYFLPFYAIIGIMVCARMLALAARYKATRVDFEAVNTPHKYYAMDALLYQAMITLQCFAIVAYLLAFHTPVFAILVKAQLNVDVAYIMSLIFAAVCLFDIVITPVPFRLLYVFPPALYCAALSALSLRRFPNRDRAIAALLAAFGVSIILGVLITFYARAIYLVVHRNRVLFALKANTPSQVHRDVNANNINAVAPPISPISPASENGGDKV